MLKLQVKKILTPKELEVMKLRFLNLCDTIALPGNIAFHYFDQLSFLYNQKDRYYHNLVHIRNFLDLKDEFLDQIEEPLLFELAIWYHDAVYDAKNNDNEQQSFLLVQDHFNNFLDSKQMIHLDHFIMSTAGHFPKSDDSDIFYFLDFDLAILATDKDIYKLYSDAIWKEYKKTYSRAIYEKGRKKILKNFLLREKLYFSDAFIVKYDKIARHNILLELNS
jgi:predicted metal-dependent HD superfamily phosphohydrolase